MSTVRANSILDSSGGNTAQINGMTPTAQSLQGFRNRIINGDMRIDQRNNGASGTSTNAYTVDRWFWRATRTGRATWQRNAGGVTPPSGFTNYLGITSSAATSLLNTDAFRIAQRIEGFNVSDLGWGAANPQPVTLSFWVRCSMTGTFGGYLTNVDEFPNYVFSYTINAANTWERKTVTIPGDTIGPWQTDNNTGIEVGFSVALGDNFVTTPGVWDDSANYYGPVGQVNVLGTNGATFYITGIQLEAGSVATPFERRDYGRELSMCQRYFQWSGFGYGASFNTGIVSMNFPLIVQMRANPTATYSNGTNALVRMGGGAESYSSITPYVVRPTFIGTNVFGSGYTVNAAYATLESNAIAISAEL